MSYQIDLSKYEIQSRPRPKAGKGWDQPAILYWFLFEPCTGRDHLAYSSLFNNWQSQAMGKLPYLANLAIFLNTMLSTINKGFVFL
jgi:hypothetical protein